jgi:uncharacterized protein YoxC
MSLTEAAIIEITKQFGSLNAQMRKAQRAMAEASLAMAQLVIDMDELTKQIKALNGKSENIDPDIQLQSKKKRYNEYLNAKEQ